MLRDCVWDGATCQGKHDAKFAQDLVDLKPKLVQLYRDALSRAAPGARLVVVGYPQPVPGRPLRQPTATCCTPTARCG
ncbi:hypothetical protein GCM10025868_07430 [Angustibacter aerolatus]|uniref:Uncharacterized protein n=1 Tax=Angustibacter aerolatus TaxID=1162965 RepID=A0ABQ6JBE9_9ACTN|nr:hypothetical protein [Angustibacter aerolatus]GMA85493.1 hypothetical protein GCM10025868_07430 [Angustibacter aerolatus]